MTRGHRLDDSPLDCLIVGAGPAGMTAALYLGRFHRRIRIIDAGASRTLWITKAHDVPGHVDGISAADMLKLRREQLRNTTCKWSLARLSGYPARQNTFTCACAAASRTAASVAAVCCWPPARCWMAIATTNATSSIELAAARPRATLATGMGALADDNLALQVDAHGLTSVPGLYAVGDVLSALDQKAVAMGHGVTTATAIHNSL